MKSKTVIAGAVVLVSLFLAILLGVSPKPPPDITVRHVKSVQVATNITTMTFEIKNHITNTYLFFPREVQVQNGNGWTNFNGTYIDDTLSVWVGPTGLVYYTVNVTNLPAKSVVRFSISAAKTLSLYVRGTEVTSDEFVETVK